MGTVAGRSVAVYAGKAGDDPSTGRLLVLTAGASMNVDSAVTLDLPRVGSLRVASARDTTLTLTDAWGVAHEFDVAAMSWVS